MNGQMGCDGCELWIESDDPEKRVEDCYAGTETRRRAGLKGWPVSFTTPVLFPERIPTACRWPDLSGQKRTEKPWLNYMPRLIFLDDMGDTFTESLPLDWLLPYIDEMERSPHIWQLLTKRPKRMHRFFQLVGRVPSNFWLGTSVTGPSKTQPTRRPLQD